jgi:hypothetical protein
MKIIVFITFLFLISPFVAYSQAGDWSKMTEKQKREMWKKREKEEKAHKKAVKEHWKKVGQEKEVGSDKTVYDRMKKTQKTSKRLANHKHRTPWMRKNKKVGKETFIEKMISKMNKKKKKAAK